jgi:Ras-related protein Rab-6A
MIQFRFEILVVGGPGVGKTALEIYLGSLNPSNRKFYNGSSRSYRSTQGMAICTLDMDTKDYGVIFLFWVISDLIDFDYIRPYYLRDSKAAILLYDITNASSINRLVEWLPLVTARDDALPMVLAGNKVDIEENRVISREEGFAFQREHSITSFREISLKTGEGVAEMFEFLRDLLLEKCKYLFE